MIGSLLYVTATRPDVMQSVGLVAKFQSAPKETHVVAVKRILRYLKGTMEYGLWYPKGKEFTMKVLIDAYWEGRNSLERAPMEHHFTWEIALYHG